jgi:hypothetical protein
MSAVLLLPLLLLLLLLLALGVVFVTTDFAPTVSLASLSTATTAGGETDHVFSLLSLSLARASAPPVVAAAASSTVSSPASSSARRVFPQLRPTVCVCVLSFRRLHLLERTIIAVVQHLEADEPDLAYEIVWVRESARPSRRVL